jgi:hypothetical protein
MPKVAGKQIADDSVTATQVDETGTLSTVNAGDVAVTGTATGIPRRDHQHAVATGGATAQIDVADTAAEGTSANLAREDHRHALPAPAAPAAVTKAAASAGSATTVARADHKHDVTTAVAVELAEANAEGVATSLARSDHTHDHGDRSGGTLHAVATGAVNGFMSAADKAKLDVLVDPNLVAPKDSIRLLATADLATLSGDQTVDGVSTGTDGDRIGLFNQTTATEDGIYITAAGAWTRAPDFANGSSQAGAVFNVEEGTSNGDTFWQVTNDDGSDVVGTDGLALAQIGSGSPRGAGAGLTLNVNDLDVVAGDGSITVNANDITVGVLQSDAQHGTRGGGTQHANAVAAGAAGFMTGADKTKIDGIASGAQVNPTVNQEEVTTQAITGTDTAITDTLNNTPSPANSLRLYLNGVKQQEGAGNDYTLSGATITWLASTGTAVDMETTDTLDAVYLS